MDKITIIGWYGTETIGDRAILGGILRVLSDKYMQYDLSIGSLFPFFSQRCLIEDESYYRELAGGHLGLIHIFDSTSVSALKREVESSTMLCFGGGPLMDISALEIMEYAFWYAHKHHVRTIVCGCGIGPLHKRKYIETVKRIIAIADVVLLRDSTSVETYHQLIGEKEIVSAIDPACFCVTHFVSTYSHELSKNNYVAMNFRDVANDEYSRQYVPRYKEYFARLIENELQKHENPIRLIPMHTFKQGGDDRYYLNEIKSLCTNGARVSVQNMPLSLFDTMKVYYEALYCYGMRFHAVLMQTLLSGRNFIIDYTDPARGKIVGLMRQLGIEDNYRNSYAALANGEMPILEDLPHVDRTILLRKIENYMEVYKQNL